MSLNILFNMPNNSNTNEEYTFLRISNQLVNERQLDMLDALHSELLEKPLLESGAYPIDHGSTHIREVMTILVNLIPESINGTFDKTGFFELLVAALIHDVAMIHMKSEGVNNEKSRKEHADRNVIEKLVSDLSTWKKISQVSRNNILDIASAHSGRDRTEVSKKQNSLKGRSGDPHLYACAKLLSIADFLNIGRSRIIKVISPDDQGPAEILMKWYAKHPEQYFHFFKHSLLNVRQIRDNSQFEVTKSNNELDKYKEIAKNIGFLGDKDEAFWEALYRVTYEEIDEAVAEIEFLIRALNCSSEIKPWVTTGIDYKKRERIYPLSSKIGLFVRTLEKSLPKDGWDKVGAFHIDLKGHSLLGTFITQEERGLKDLIKEGVENGSVHLRILLLDPYSETQQKLEVFQKQVEARAGRFILPQYQYDEDGRHLSEGDDERGDILRVFDEIKKWNPGPGGSIEMRFTNRLMYVNINRFEDNMIISHYGRSGFFEGSMAIKADKENSLFQSHVSEFEDIWNDCEMTRLAVHQGDSINTRSPSEINKFISWIARENQRSAGPHEESPFDYETSFLKDDNKIGSSDFVVHKLR